MSIDCSIDTIIDLAYNAKNIKLILNRGKELGSTYSMGVTDEILNLDDAVYTAMHPDVDAPEMIFLAVEIKGIRIHLFFRKTSKNKLNVDFSLWHNIWRTKNGNFDTKRYLDIVLEFLTPFKILKVNYDVL